MTKGQHKKGALPFVTGHQNRGRRFSQAGKPRGFPEGTLLDDADREVYGVHRWSISGNGYLQRAKRLADGRLTKVRLHREILGQPAGIVDHINGNRLDNRR
ncbi:MAG: hypothetical protein KGL17_04085, partial [Betaproteobacteria bacterium]|nr:hypothetical protein [Betaproteobacteria bacterium]